MQPPAADLWSFQFSFFADMLPVACMLLKFITPLPELSVCSWDWLLHLLCASLFVRLDSKSKMAQTLSMNLSSLVCVAPRLWAEPEYLYCQSFYSLL